MKKKYLHEYTLTELLIENEDNVEKKYEAKLKEILPKLARFDFGEQEGVIEEYWQEGHTVEFDEVKKDLAAIAKIIKLRQALYKLFKGITSVPLLSLVPNSVTTGKIVIDGVIKCCKGLTQWFSGTNPFTETLAPSFGDVYALEDVAQGLSDLLQMKNDTGRVWADDDIQSSPWDSYISLDPKWKKLVAPNLINDFIEKIINEDPEMTDLTDEWKKGKPIDLDMAFQDYINDGEHDWKGAVNISMIKVGVKEAGDELKTLEFFDWDRYYRDLNPDVIEKAAEDFASFKGKIDNSEYPELVPLDFIVFLGSFMFEISKAAGKLAMIGQSDVSTGVKDAFEELYRELEKAKEK